MQSGSNKHQCFFPPPTNQVPLSSNVTPIHKRNQVLIGRLALFRFEHYRFSNSLMHSSSANYVSLMFTSEVTIVHIQRQIYIEKYLEIKSHRFLKTKSIQGTSQDQEADLKKLQGHRMNL